MFPMLIIHVFLLHHRAQLVWTPCAPGLHQALITHSVFIMDWTRPVPLTEFFLPLDDALSFDSHRACLSAPELRWARHNPMVESSQRRNDSAIQETIAAAEGAPAQSATLLWHPDVGAGGVTCNAPARVPSCFNNAVAVKKRPLREAQT